MAKQLFRYSFKQGQELSYLIKINGGLDIFTPTGVLSNPIKMEMGIAQIVVSSDGDSAVLKMRIDSMELMSNMASDRLPELGAGFVMKIDSLGNMHWIDGKAAWEGAEHSFIVFPTHEIQTGDSWVSNIATPAAMAPPLYTKYRFNGFDRRRKQLNNFSTEVFEGHPDAKDSKSIGKGTFSFNSEDSWIEESGIYMKYEHLIPFPDEPSIKFKTVTGLRIDMERVK
jgi:hypothetical protein